MTASPLTRRCAALFGLALQLLVPVSATLADARLEAESARFRVHIESHSTPRCPRLHPDNCALCSFLSATPVPAQTVTFVLRDVAAGMVPFGEHRYATLAGRVGPPARAPPTIV